MNRNVPKLNIKALIYFCFPKKGDLCFCYIWVQKFAELILNTLKFFNLKKLVKNDYNLSNLKKNIALHIIIDNNNGFEILNMKLEN